MTANPTSANDGALPGVFTMTTYQKFSDALESFREEGGAMIYFPVNAEYGSYEPPCWMVAQYDVISGMTDDALDATKTALSIGGMSDQEISDELADWKEPA